MAARLAAQEDQIEVLTQEISTLRDGLVRGVPAAGVNTPSPELQTLRNENEKLRYRLLHLRRGLQAELELEQGQGVRQKGPQWDKAPQKTSSHVQQINHQDQSNRKDNKKVLRVLYASQFKSSGNCLLPVISNDKTIASPF